MATKSELCIRCGDCCKFFIMEIRKPDLPQEVKDWREWMGARGIIVLREHSKWWRLRINHPCPHLHVVEKEALIVMPEHTKDRQHFCDIYGGHPEICKHFDGRMQDRRDGLKCLWTTEKFEG